MKIKKLSVVLSLLMGCALIFSACSNGTKFRFDKNSAVKLTYACADEANNFETELSADESNNFIRSLNKISYSEVANKYMTFASSYDSLTIETNDETLRLYDVAAMINYGGYFRYNDTLCKSEEKFGFLENYLGKYRSEIIPSSIPFEVRYVKQTVDGVEPNQIIKSVDELNEYIASETQKIDLPDFQLFPNGAIAKYDDEYFENSFLAICMAEASSGSYHFMVDDVGICGKRLVVYYQIYLPGNSDGSQRITCDMAYWYSFLELSNEYSAVERVDPVSVK